MTKYLRNSVSYMIRHQKRCTWDNLPWAWMDLNASGPEPLQTQSMWTQKRFLSMFSDVLRSISRNSGHLEICNLTLMRLVDSSQGLWSVWRPGSDFLEILTDWAVLYQTGARTRGRPGPASSVETLEETIMWTLPVLFPCSKKRL